MRNVIISGLMFFILIGSLFSLSEDIHITQYVETEDGKLLGISRENGFVISYNNGRTWVPKNNGIPEQIVYPFEESNPIPSTAIAVDPTNSNRIALTSSWGMYVSEDQGSSWEVLTLASPVKGAAYVTSAAVSPHDKNTFLLGTSFSGLYITFDRGKTWIEYETLMEPLYQGAGFLEEISSIVYHPYEENIVYIAIGFGNGLYQADLDRQILTRIDFPGDNNGAFLEQIIGKVDEAGSRANGRFTLQVHTNFDSWEYSPASARWTKLSPQKSYTQGTPEDKSRRLKAASDKSGIYLKSYNVSGEDLISFITFIKQHGMNSFVVDVKDDLGRVTYNTALQMPINIGATRDHFNMQALLETAHEHGIYVIGRIVCFQDPILYRHNNYQYAIWNYQQNGPWSHKFKVVDDETEEVKWVQREFWVDTFSEDVWKYNISIAEELQELGIDEVQFDYIRFPSDGDMTGIYWRYQKEGMQKIDALESFLRFTRERIHIPVSTDLYGFNSWYRMGNWIGQNIEMVSHYVDAISPMYYPSHFPREFLKEMAYFPRARHIYKEGSIRAAYITEGRTVIRPYVQAFLIGGEVNFELSEYSDYLIQQLEGAKEGFASGFTLWNNSNRYYMVTQPLTPYTKENNSGTTALMN